MLGAVFPAVWQLLLLKDVRDVLRSQVYPFVHVKVDTAQILETAGGDEAVAMKTGYRVKGFRYRCVE